MRTNIDIDDELMAGAMKALGTTSKKSTVEAALAEAIRRHRQRKALDLVGTVEWDGDLDQWRREA